MSKNADISKILNIIAENEDKATLDRIAKDIVEKYPEKAASILKGLKNEENFEDNLVTVTSARDLSAGQKDRIEGTLSKKFSYPLSFTYKVEPMILGGVILKKGEYVIDNTLRSRIDQLIVKIS